jgi:hypothetical protein
VCAPNVCWSALSNPAPPLAEFSKKVFEICPQKNPISKIDFSIFWQKISGSRSLAQYRWNSEPCVKKRHCLLLSTQIKPPE